MDGKEARGRERERRRKGVMKGRIEGARERGPRKREGTEKERGDRERERGQRKREGTEK